MKTQPTTILLIEDDEEDFILLKKHLSRIRDFHYEVIWASSYDHGLACMEESAHDICMVDYWLGAYNGIELIKAARRRGYEQPIVLLTGASNSDIDIQALQVGADDYIDKGKLQGELLQRVIRYAIERKKAEHEREKLLRAQIESREIEAKKNEFIGMVVHELKTPLTSLKGYVQLTGKRCMKNGDERTSQLVERMDLQINKLNALINDFQDVTRFVAGKLRLRESYFAFDTMVKEIIDEIQLIYPQQIIQQEGEVSALVWGDPIRIGQVITNLLTNAIKYASMSDRFLVKTSADEHNVTLTVQDFGPGIPPELQTKIFDPFYRIESSSQQAITGLGLGLHIAAEIIKRHEGRIWVESEPGQGAAFSFTLPLDRPRAVECQEQQGLEEVSE
jgi:signal transduction histidine kinase